MTDNNDHGDGARWSRASFTVRPLIVSAVLAIVAAALVWLVATSATANAAAMYSGIFGILAIAAGFLSTFYVFIATRSNRFLDSIRETRTFSQLVAMLRDTISLTLVAVLITFIIMVVEPRGYHLVGMVSLFIFLWCWVVILAAVNFTRCARLFFRIVSTN